MQRLEVSGAERPIYGSLGVKGLTIPEVLTLCTRLPARCVINVTTELFFISPLWRCDPTLTVASSFSRILDHTQRRITVGRTPLDESSARRRDVYLTPHNTHNRQTSMPPVGFEPTISAGVRPQPYALNRTATGTGNYWAIFIYLFILCYGQMHSYLTKYHINIFDVSAI